MREIQWSTTTLLIPLLSVVAYMPAASRPYSADMDISAHDISSSSLEQNILPGATSLTLGGTGDIKISMQLPDYYGAYVEIFGCSNLLSGQWKVLESWIPTYGSSGLTWNDAARTNAATYFYMVNDATMDFDGDGFSDSREHYISFTDAERFDTADEDGDGLHDFWEVKLFGNIWTQEGNDDFDGDGLRNNQELEWVDHTIRMYSDPTLYDTDGEGLDDFTELRMQTDPLSADSDSDGYDDAFEVLGSPPTDPNNPDIIPPVLILAGG